MIKPGNEDCFTKPLYQVCGPNRCAIIHTDGNIMQEKTGKEKSPA